MSSFSPQRPRGNLLPLLRAGHIVSIWHDVILLSPGPPLAPVTPARPLPPLPLLNFICTSSKSPDSSFAASLAGRRRRLSLDGSIRVDDAEIRPWNVGILPQTCVLAPLHAEPADDASSAAARQSLARADSLASATCGLYCSAPLRRGDFFSSGDSDDLDGCDFPEVLDSAPMEAVEVGARERDPGDVFPVLPLLALPVRLRPGVRAPVAWKLAVLAADDPLLAAAVDGEGNSDPAAVAREIAAVAAAVLPLVADWAHAAGGFTAVGPADQWQVLQSPQRGEEDAGDWEEGARKAQVVVEEAHSAWRLLVSTLRRPLLERRHRFSQRVVDSWVERNAVAEGGSSSSGSGSLLRLVATTTPGSGTFGSGVGDDEGWGSSASCTDGELDVRGRECVKSKVRGGGCEGGGGGLKGRASARARSRLSVTSAAAKAAAAAAALVTPHHRRSSHEDEWAEAEDRNVGEEGEFAPADAAGDTEDAAERTEENGDGGRGDSRTEERGVLQGVAAGGSGLGPRRLTRTSSADSNSSSGSSSRRSSVENLVPLASPFVMVPVRTGAAARASDMPRSAAPAAVVPRIVESTSISGSCSAGGGVADCGGGGGNVGGGSRSSWGSADSSGTSATSGASSSTSSSFSTTAGAGAETDQDLDKFGRYSLGITRFSPAFEPPQKQCKPDVPLDPLPLPPGARRSQSVGQRDILLIDCSAPRRSHTTGRLASSAYGRSKGPSVLAGDLAGAGSDDASGADQTDQIRRIRDPTAVVRSDTVPTHVWSSDWPRFSPSIRRKSHTFTSSSPSSTPTSASTPRRANRHVWGGLDAVFHSPSHGDMRTHSGPSHGLAHDHSSRSSHNSRSGPSTPHSRLSREASEEHQQQEVFRSHVLIHGDSSPPESQGQSSPHMGSSHGLARGHSTPATPQSRLAREGVEEKQEQEVSRSHVLIHGDSSPSESQGQSNPHMGSSHGLARGHSTPCTPQSRLAREGSEEHQERGVSRSHVLIHGLSSPHKGSSHGLAHGHSSPRGVASHGLAHGHGTPSTPQSRLAREGSEETREQEVCRSHVLIHGHSSPHGGASHSLIHEHSSPATPQSRLARGGSEERHEQEVCQSHVLIHGHSSPHGNASHGLIRGHSPPSTPQSRLAREGCEERHEQEVSRSHVLIHGHSSPSTPQSRLAREGCKEHEEQEVSRSHVLIHGVSSPHRNASHGLIRGHSTPQGRLMRAESEEQRELQECGLVRRLCVPVVPQSRLSGEGNEEHQEHQEQEVSRSHVLIHGHSSPGPGRSLSSHAHSCSPRSPHRGPSLRLFRGHSTPITPQSRLARGGDEEHAQQEQEVSRSHVRIHGLSSSHRGASHGLMRGDISPSTPQSRPSREGSAEHQVSRSHILIHGLIRGHSSPATPQSRLAREGREACQEHGLTRGHSVPVVLQSRLAREGSEGREEQEELEQRGEQEISRSRSWGWHGKVGRVSSRVSSRVNGSRGKAGRDRSHGAASHPSRGMDGDHDDGDCDGDDDSAVVFSCYSMFSGPRKLRVVCGSSWEDEEEEEEEEEEGEEGGEEEGEVECQAREIDGSFHYWPRTSRTLSAVDDPAGGGEGSTSALEGTCHPFMLMLQGNSPHMAVHVASQS